MCAAEGGERKLKNVLDPVLVFFQGGGNTVLQLRHTARLPNGGTAFAFKTMLGSPACGDNTGLQHEDNTPDSTPPPRVTDNLHFLFPG